VALVAGQDQRSVRAWYLDPKASRSLLAGNEGFPVAQGVLADQPDSGFLEFFAGCAVVAFIHGFHAERTVLLEASRRSRLRTAWPTRRPGALLTLLLPHDKPTTCTIDGTLWRASGPVLRTDEQTVPV